jgi:hypothetical protein
VGGPWAGGGPGAGREPGPAVEAAPADSARMRLAGTANYPLTAKVGEVILVSNLEE